MYDIIIVGGGISGSIAAIAAARKDAKVLLIEKMGFLGGALTSSGVGPMMTFHAGNEQVIKGITGELIDRLVKKNKSPGHIVDTTGYTYSVTPFESEGMKYELESMLINSGGKILYHTMLADVETDNGKIVSIKVCNKEGLTKIYGKCFIDATGDGDLSAWAGVETTKGREEDGISQPMTMNIKMRGVNIEEIKEYMRQHPDQFEKNIPLLDKSPRLSIGGFKDIVKLAKENGELELNTKGSVLLFETDKPGEVIINSTRVIDCDSTDSWSFSEAEINGRKESMEFIPFLKKYVPGFKNAEVEYTGPTIGVRGSRQIKGIYTLTKEDVIGCKQFNDAIAYSGYPIDIHNPKGSGGKSIHLNWGDCYSIPYRCLVNPIINNLITVGRCISATFEAQAAIRVSPTAGAIGHAGGLAAYIYISEDVDRASSINIKELQKNLIEQDAYMKI